MLGRTSCYEVCAEVDVPVRVGDEWGVGRAGLEVDACYGVRAFDGRLQCFNNVATESAENVRKINEAESSVKK